MTTNNSPQIVNRKAKFEFQFLDTYIAGIELKGTEVKSIREGKVQLAEAYCYFNNGELFIRDMQITPYKFGNIHNPDPRRERRLLLKKKDLEKLKAKSEEQGLTIIPFRMFFNERNFCKLEIALAKGKKLFDKRETIKERDQKRESEKITD